MFNITLPENVNFIIDTLTSNGFEAYAVGGCVRDSLLGRIPDDWDITTSASPEQVKALFRRTIDTGIEHGTVTVMIDKEGYEVTTYRIDGKYKDGRHPEEVSFTKSLEEDLKRRDFTINAMAYNNIDGIVDLFGGQKDLEQKIVRCVGDAKKRFSEDALRILRAVRFSAQLNFSIDKATSEAAEELAPTLKKISAERIRVELDKLICSKHPEKLLDAYETGITSVVLPEFDEMMKVTPEGQHHIYSVGMHSIIAMQNIPAEPHFLRWTMLLHDIAKPSTECIDVNGRAKYPDHGKNGSVMAANVMKRLKFDNYQLNMVKHLIRYHDEKIFGLDDVALRQKISMIGPEYMEYLFLCHRADNTAKAPEGLERVMQKIDATYRQYRSILERGECLVLKDLAVTGKDLIAAGITEGKEIGDTLTKLLDMVLTDPSLNTRDALLATLTQK